VTPLERILRRDRWVLSALLALLTVGAWWAWTDEGLMPCCAGPGTTFAMWVVMMAGMMIPSVAPMVLTHAAVARRRGAPLGSTGLFLGGYLVAWSGFAAVAALTQTLLARAGLLDGRSFAIAPWAGAAVLLAAGAFQLAPAKDACLAHCRAPLGYFVTDWREGRAGAVVMGLRHGVYCIGCCWLLMAVLFAVGTMNVVWSAAITAFVVAEKLLPWRRAVVWSGAAMCLVGAGALVLA
jgi:predicted metal-binding membrane protein